MLFDLRFALRQILRNPGFTAVALATLALGIGVNTTMFSVLNALVLQESATRESDRLAIVYRTSSQAQDGLHSPADFGDIVARQTSFESVGAFYGMNVNLAEPGQPAERLAGMAVSGSAFTMFGIAPEIGRTFGPEYDSAGHEPVVVLSDGYWRTHFGADPAVIGKTFRMDGQPATVIGVMPAAFGEPVTFWGHVDIWRPLGYDGPTRLVRDNHWMQMIGRLKPGVTLGAAQAEATAIASKLAAEYPKTDEGNGLRVDTWDRARTGDLNRNISWTCMMLAGFVLLIACANLTNLQLARVSTRVREQAVRIAVGASRFQIVRQLLIESLLLAALGGAIGVLVAEWATRIIGNGIYIAGVRGMAMPVDTRVLAFTVLASMAAGIAAGTIPAWIAARTDVNTALKQGARGSTGDRSRHLFRRALIVAELALALVLLAGAGFFVRGMQRFTKADMGWKPDGLVTANLSLPFNANYVNDAQCQAFFDKLVAGIGEVPGLQKATLATFLPIVGFWKSAAIDIQGRPHSVGGKGPVVYVNSVTPGHFDTMGIRLIRGRDFTRADRSGSRRVAVINETMARVLWPGEDPVGRRFMSGDGAIPDWAEVVGVVADVHPSLELVRPPDTPFQVYLALAQTPSQFSHWFSIAALSSAPPEVVAAAIRSAVQRIDADQPVYAIISAREAIKVQITSGFTLTAQILGAFALVGLALSAVGIYGVVSHLVAQRTSEIGIRMALGAQVKDVLWLVLGQGVRLAAVGAAIGLGLAWALVRLLTSVIPALHGSDPVTVAGVAVLLSTVAVFACWIPARRATRISPTEALRAE
jgi:predicted permease